MPVGVHAGRDQRVHRQDAAALWTLSVELPLTVTDAAVDSILADCEPYSTLLDSTGGAAVTPRIVGA